jgi:hypothetical protein
VSRESRKGKADTEHLPLFVLANDSLVRVLGLERLPSEDNQRDIGVNPSEQYVRVFYERRE